MSLFQRWYGIWHRLREYSVTTGFAPETAAVVSQHAEEAYRFCVRLFGPPIDPQIRYEIRQGERSFHGLSRGVHIISIARPLIPQKEELCEIIAHEMYHRVTAGRQGLANELWIKELMATLTSRWFLQQHGLKDYADWMKKTVMETEGKADVNLLRNWSQSALQYILDGEAVYSDAFLESVRRTGYALENAVRVPDLLSIIKANTLEEWVVSLPIEDQYTACRIMELPTEDKAVPISDREVGRLFLALRDKGDKEALVAEFEKFVQFQPENSTVLFHMGMSYQRAKRPDEAISAYLKAKELGYSDKWLLHNMGSAYSQKKDYRTASEWYRKAIEQEPDWASAYYYLGHALNQIGDPAGANAEWEKVLMLGDEHYAKMARKNLQKNPLADTLTEQ